MQEGRQLTKCDLAGSRRWVFTPPRCECYMASGSVASHRGFFGSTFVTRLTLPLAAIARRQME